MTRRPAALAALLSLAVLAACGESTSPTAVSSAASTAPRIVPAVSRSGGSSSGGGGGGVTSTGGGGTVKVDQIKVSKCFWNSGGEMLIKAASSDPTATLTAYTPSGALIGYVQNGGGSRYGGTVMPYTPVNPVTVTIRSSAGGSVDVPTGPFVL